MIETALVLAVLAVALAVGLAFMRLLRGPDAPDRVLALDTLSYNAVALLLLADLYFGHEAFVAAVVVIAMVGFVSTVALSMFLLRGDFIE